METAMWALLEVADLLHATHAQAFRIDHLAKTPVSISIVLNAVHHNKSVLFCQIFPPINCAFRNSVYACSQSYYIFFLP